MKKIYICCTYYHLLISICKVFITKEKADLLICTSWNDCKLLNDEKIISKLKDKNIFENILIYDYGIEKLEKIKHSKFKNFRKFLFVKEMKKNFPIDFSSYSEISLFSEMTPIGRYLNENKMYYSLLEDGTDCFKYNKTYIKRSKSLMHFIKSSILGYKDLGESKYIKYIEVNDKNGIFIDNKNVIEFKKNNMFSLLSRDEKNDICEIFLNDIDFKYMNNSVLIITQPLYEDGLVEKLEDQVEIYKEIIQKYSDGCCVIIKKHPRDNIEYKKYFDNCIIDDGCYPIEIINLFDINIEKAVTISSTSINLLSNIKEKIYLGWEWLDEYKKRKQ